MRDHKNIAGRRITKRELLLSNLSRPGASRPVLPPGRPARQAAPGACRLPNGDPPSLILWGEEG